MQTDVHIGCSGPGSTRRKFIDVHKPVNRSNAVKPGKCSTRPPSACFQFHCIAIDRIPSKGALKETDNTSKHFGMAQ